MLDIKKEKSKKIIGVEDLSEYLRTLIVTGSIQNFDESKISYNNCGEFLLFLCKLKKNMNVQRKHSFYHYALFGFYLHQFYILFITQPGMINKTWTELVKDQFEISDTYARTLRFIGKLCGEYKQQLSIGVNEFIKYKEQLKIIFYSNKYPHIQEQWH